MGPKPTNKLWLWILIVIIATILGVAGYFIYQKQIVATEKAAQSPGPIVKSLIPNSGFSSKNNPNGPYYHQIFSAISQDGLTFEKQGAMIFDHASVPGAVVKSNKIYLYFVDASGNEDQLSVAVSADLGKTFEKQKVSINGADSPAVDPDPVLLDNGKIRLYYFASSISTGDPAMAAGIHQIMSAESNDGINFDEPRAVFAEENITDPDVFKTTTDWRLFVSKGTGLDLAVSSDNGKTFQKHDDFSWNKGGVSNTLKIGDVYHTYYCGAGGIGSATGAETGKLTTEEGTRLPAEQGQIVCDPSVIQLPDGSYLMFYKTAKPYAKVH